MSGFEIFQDNMENYYEYVVKIKMECCKRPDTNGTCIGLSPREEKFLLWKWIKETIKDK